MQWRRISATAVRSDEYVIQKQDLWGDMNYFPEHKGELLAVCCDADRAKEVCEEHAEKEGKGSAGATHRAREEVGVELHENGDGV
jgi:hypothetical protein